MKIPRASLNRIAIAFLILAVFDMIVGQKTLASICAGIAIALSLLAPLISGRSSKNRKGR
ncbi:MAG: hypothetical protein ABSH03_09620 [Candidatus Lustribacter sp.]